MLSKIAAVLFAACGLLLIIDSQSTALLRADDTGTESKYVIKTGNKCHTVSQRGATCVTCSTERDESKCKKCETQEGLECSESDASCGNLMNQPVAGGQCAPHGGSGWMEVVDQAGDPIKCKKLKEATGAKKCPKKDAGDPTPR